MVLGLVASIGLSACFYVPKIDPVPVELDTPPFILGFEPEVVVDLRESGTVRFAVDAVYDMNPPEEIDWTIEMYLTPSAIGPFSVGSGTLRQREVQSFPDATEYQGPVVEFERCPTLAQARGDGEVVNVDLVLRDPLPRSQRREGFDAYTPRYTWRVRVIGECEQ